MNSNALLISRKQELPLKEHGLFMEVMIAIAVFLFSIALAGTLSINSMLSGWNESILGSLTVQIMPLVTADKEQSAAEMQKSQTKVVEVLQSLNVIEKVAPLENKDLEKLIKPWLGDGINIENLPIPRLIDVKLKPGVDVDFNQLAAKLAETSPLASLDNHKLWLSKLINFADGLQMLALTVLALVITVTSGAIFYSTQTSLGLHRYTIEILHQMGAKDTYIAQQYAKRTAFLGLIGGFFGLMFAIPAILGMASLAQKIEGGIISGAHLALDGWIIILSQPFAASFIAMITAYYTVKRTLSKMM